MLYQELKVGRDPFYIAAGKAEAFGLHRHTEIELSYCIKGSYRIGVGKNVHCLQAGDLAVVAPMAAHEFPESDCEETERMTVEVGPALLGELFGPFTTMDPNGMVFRLRTHDNALSAELESILLETAQLLNGQPPFYHLSVKGNIFRLSALLLQIMTQQQNSGHITKEFYKINQIEKSLDIIHKRYREALDIETVSSMCGYGKSNFCKIFKSITGDTFHNVLNSHRIQIACMHLENSSIPIEEIAFQVGFTDVKSFCRVFKKITGENAGSYRKKNQKEKL